MCEACCGGIFANRKSASPRVQICVHRWPSSEYLFLCNTIPQLESNRDAMERQSYCATVLNNSSARLTS